MRGERSGTRRLRFTITRYWHRCWRFLTGTNFKLVHAPKAAVFHRYRTTAKDFFIMHMRYGYGLALIFSKYPGELSWGW